MTRKKRQDKIKIGKFDGSCIAELGWVGGLGMVMHVQVVLALVLAVLTSHDNQQLYNYFISQIKL